MNRIIKRNEILALTALFVSALVAFLFAGSADAASDGEITETYMITIEVDDQQGSVTIENSNDTYVSDFIVDEIDVRDGSLFIPPDLEITPENIVAGSKRYSIRNLRIEEIYEGNDDLIGVVLRHRKSSSSARNRRTSRNRIAVAEKLVINDDDFVRGDVICFGGNIEVGGEVNRNVVAFFGNVHIMSDGIVRGNIVAVDGKVRLRGEASVYGKITSHRGLRKDRRSRTRFSPVSWGVRSFRPNCYYNRVDGLCVGAGIGVADPDSMLPSLYAKISYAFTSKRPYYDIGAHQRFWDKYSFTIGGSFFKQTSTDDSWLSSELETTVLALLAAEDFRDYYGQEGGRAYLTFSPGYYNELGVSYGFSELRWMDHHPKLWSLFGWDKEFRANFSSVQAEERRNRQKEFEANLGELRAWYTLDTRDDDEETYCGWWVNIEYLTAGDKLKGDLAFDRFTAEVRRFQPLSHCQNINVRLKYGTSGRDLPLFRTFYLGGMRTIRGFRHKSFRGEQMLLGNFEYVIDFPRLSFDTALLFDVGKVAARNESILSDGEFHSSVGIRLSVMEGFSVEVAKSLNDSDEPIKLWVLFQSSF